MPLLSSSAHLARYRNGEIGAIAGEAYNLGRAAPLDSIVSAFDFSGSVAREEHLPPVKMVAQEGAHAVEAIYTARNGAGDLVRIYEARSSSTQAFDFSPHGRVHDILLKPFIQSAHQQDGKTIDRSDDTYKSFGVARVELPRFSTDMHDSAKDIELKDTSVIYSPMPTAVYLTGERYSNQYRRKVYLLAYSIQDRILRLENIWRQRNRSAPTPSASDGQPKKRRAIIESDEEEESVEVKPKKRRVIIESDDEHAPVEVESQ